MAEGTRSLLLLDERNRELVVEPNLDETGAELDSEAPINSCFERVTAFPVTFQYSIE